MKRESPQLAEVRELFKDYVSWDSSEYQDYLKSQKESVFRYKKSFGEFVIDFNVDEAAIDHPLTDSFLYPCTQTLDRIIGEGNEYGLSEIRNFFAEGLADAEVRQDTTVQKITRGMVGDPRAPAQILDAYSNGEIDKRLLIKFLRVHAMNFITNEKKFEREVPKIRERFVKSLQKLIEDPRHPLTADMLPKQLIEQRLDATLMIVGDPLALSRESVAIGDFNPSFELITVAYERPANRYKGKDVVYEKTCQHEMIHALSGRTVAKASRRIYTHLRLGLLNAVTGSGSWLNEAITEQLNQDLKGKGRNFLHGSYLKQRDAYKQLLMRIPEELFLKAYFENTETDASDPTPHTTALKTAIDQAFGQGFLEKLDQSFRNNESDVADVFKEVE